MEQEEVRRWETVLYKCIPSPLDSESRRGAGYTPPPAAFFGASQECAGNRPGAMLLPTTVCVWWDNTPLLVAHIMRGNAIRHIALFAHICGSMRCV